MSIPSKLQQDIADGKINMDGYDPADYDDEIEEDQESIYEEDYLDDDNDDGDDSLADYNNYE